MDIVLIQTGNDRLKDTPEYYTRGPGMSAAATRFILDQGVKVTGIDSWGWDAALPGLAEKAKRTGRRGIHLPRASHFRRVDSNR